MKRMSPLAILLAGISVAAVMLGVGWQWNRIVGTPAAVLAGASAEPSPEIPGDAGPVPEDSATPPQGNGGEAPPVDKEPVAQAEPMTGTWAGHLKEGSLAIAAKNGAAIAYLCDGDKLEEWMTGTAIGGKLDLKSDDGSRLTGTADKKQAKGTVTVDDGKARTFDIDVAKKPSGLYRFASQVRGAKIVGGWIVLKDGRQVGLATVDGQVVKPSTLDVTTGKATVGGETITAVPAEDRTS